MKKIFAITAIFALLFTACGDGDSEKNNGNNNGNDGTTLKIQNESFSEITEVKWSDLSFGRLTKGSYFVNGSNAVTGFEGGIGYIYFKRETSPINARTDELITISKGEKRTFVITDNTIIVEVDNTSNKGAFGTLSASAYPYSVGDTGPGGGIVFFAQGGQYKEGSGELGTHNGNDAVNTAMNYQGGGFNDWRLPDMGELDLLYQNRTTIGGFSGEWYWSSAEYSNTTAYRKDFHYGMQDTGPKSSSYRVRAVRNF
jgi:hypothetical protein